jgi:hypothetical protein
MRADRLPPRIDPEFLAFLFTELDEFIVVKYIQVRLVLVSLARRMISVCQYGILARNSQVTLPLQKFLDMADYCADPRRMFGPGHFTNPDARMSILKICFVHEVVESGVLGLICEFLAVCHDFISVRPVIAFLETIHPRVAPSYLREILLPLSRRYGFDLSDIRFSHPLPFPFSRLLMNMFTQFADYWAFFHLDLVMKMIEDEQTKVYALREIEHIVEAPAVEKCVLNRLARGLDVIRALASQDDLPVIRKLVTCLASHNVLQPSELMAAAPAPELLVHCFGFFRESIDQAVVDQILGNQEMTPDKARFLVQVFVLKGTELITDSENVLIKCFRFWRRDFRDLLAACLFKPELRELLINAMAQANVPGGDFCFLLQLANVTPDEVARLDLVNQLFFQLDAVDLLLALTQYPFLQVGDFGLFFEFCPVCPLFVHYFLANALPLQIEKVRDWVINANDADLFIGCYHATQDIEFLLRALRLDNTVRASVQDVIDHHSDEFLDIVHRLLNSGDGLSFVSTLEAFDYSQIPKQSIDGNENLLVFRNCEPPSNTETLVEKLPLLQVLPPPMMCSLIPSVDTRTIL